MIVLGAVVFGLMALPSSDAARSAPPPTVYYLHGKIVEDLGPAGVSPQHGPYDYTGILKSLRGSGVEVISEVRPKNTDPWAYADKLVMEIQGKIAAGTPPSRITVIGASKGSIIASLVSARLKVAGVRYVLMAGCNDWLLREVKPKLTGDILSIYEASDEIGQTCKPVVDQSPAVGSFREIRLETGLGHGILYRPLREWVGPAVDWAKR